MWVQSVLDEQQAQCQNASGFAQQHPACSGCPSLWEYSAKITWATCKINKLFGIRYDLPGHLTVWKGAVELEQWCGSRGGAMSANANTRRCTYLIHSHSLWIPWNEQPGRRRTDPWVSCKSRKKGERERNVIITSIVLCLNVPILEDAERRPSRVAPLCEAFTMTRYFQTLVIEWRKRMRILKGCEI